MADHFGISNTSYGRWENGSEPSYVDLVKLAEFFRVTVDDLLLKEFTSENIPNRYALRPLQIEPTSKVEIVQDYEAMSDNDLLKEIFEKVQELGKVQAALRQEVDDLKKERQSNT